MTLEDILKEFGKGCTITSPVLGGQGNPALCEECLAGAVRAILNRYKPRKFQQKVEKNAS